MKHSKRVGAQVLAEYDWSVYKHQDFVQPVLVTKSGTVIDGAHRVVAARELGKKIISAIVLDADVVYLDPNDLVTWLDYAIDDGNNNSSSSLKRLWRWIRRRC